jgi:FtsZ-binding cell division protein ZapB
VISLVEVAKRTSRLEEQIKTQAEQIELLKTQLEDLKAKPNGEKRTYRKRNPSQD